MEEKQNEKLVFNVAMLTTSVLTLVVIIVCSMLAIFFPLNWANFMFALGLKNASLISYTANYHKTNTIDDLYLLIGKSITSKNYEYQIKFIPELFEKEGYSFFITQVENKNIAASPTRQAVLYVGNEDEYLKGKYVVALYNSDMKAQALSYCINSVKNIEVNNLSDRISFPLGYYVNNMNVTELSSIAPYVNDIYSYYNDLKAVISGYDIKSEESTELIKFYLALFSKQLVDVSNVLVKLDGLNNEQLYRVNELKSEKESFLQNINYYCFRQ